MVSIWSTSLSGLLLLGTPAHPQRRIRFTVVVCKPWTQTSGSSLAPIRPSCKVTWGSCGCKWGIQLHRQPGTSTSFIVGLVGLDHAIMFVIFGNIQQYNVTAASRGSVRVFSEWRGNADTLQSPLLLWLKLCKHTSHGDFVGYCFHWNHQLNVEWGQLDLLCAWSHAKVSWSFPDSFQTSICCFLMCNLMLPFQINK